MQNIAGLKTKELIALYNEHSGKPAISAWKRKVTDLVAALLKMKPDLFYVDTAHEPSRPAPEFVEDNVVELRKQSGRPADHGEADVKPAKAKKAKASKADSDRGAIRRYAEELLLKARGTDPATKRPLGLPYGEILEAMTKKFPNAETSLNCLRWYATKLNKRTGKEAVQMPIRPKAKAEAA